MELYYLENYSLGEIADEYGVSRQAVYDNIKRTEAMLEGYEAKLLLLEKFQMRQEIINQCKDALLNQPRLTELLAKLEKLD